MRCLTASFLAVDASHSPAFEAYLYCWLCYWCNGCPTLPSVLLFLSKSVTASDLMVNTSWCLAVMIHSMSWLVTRDSTAPSVHSPSVFVLFIYLFDIFFTFKLWLEKSPVKYTWNSSAWHWLNQVVLRLHCLWSLKTVTSLGLLGWLNQTLQQDEVFISKHSQSIPTGMAERPLTLAITLPLCALDHPSVLLRVSDIL